MHHEPYSMFDQENKETSDLYGSHVNKSGNRKIWLFLNNFQQASFGKIFTHNKHLFVIFEYSQKLQQKKINVKQNS